MYDCTGCYLPIEGSVLEDENGQLWHPRCYGDRIEADNKWLENYSKRTEKLGSDFLDHDHGMDY